MLQLKDTVLLKLKLVKQCACLSNKAEKNLCFSLWKIVMATDEQLIFLPDAEPEDAVWKLLQNSTVHVSCQLLGG